MAVELQEAPERSPLVGDYEPSPAGPISESEQLALPKPPMVPLPTAAQVLRFSMRQAEFLLHQKRALGEVFRIRGVIPGGPAISSHPDHARSIFTAKPELVPSLTAESPLRPIVGPDSVLTAQGARHIRQRKLLLPAFHGDAIARYIEMIQRATEKEIDSWDLDREFEIAGRMQAITLDVIMAGIFGFEGRPDKHSPEGRLRLAIKRATEVSTWPIAKVTEILNLGTREPRGLAKVGVRTLDIPTYQVIAERRKADDLTDRADILSMLLLAETEEGERLSDREVRDELLTLVLAGHETTANTLAWAWERLTRNPDAYDTLKHAVRSGGEDADEQIEWVINETMRNRPLVPIVGRRTTVPWQLGEYGVAAGTPISISIVMLHHREDLYPDPWNFRPERWRGNKPGTYEWIPFGGGTRRCLGASLAMAEMRVVIKQMAQRLELECDRPEAEHVQHRNVTMIPARGGRVLLRSRAAA